MGPKTAVAPVEVYPLMLIWEGLALDLVMITSLSTRRMLTMRPSEPRVLGPLDLDVDHLIMKKLKLELGLEKGVSPQNTDFLGETRKSLYSVG